MSIDDFRPRNSNSSSIVDQILTSIQICWLFGPELEVYAILIFLRPFMHRFLEVWPTFCLSEMLQCVPWHSYQACWLFHKLWFSSDLHCWSAVRDGEHCLFSFPWKVTVHCFQNWWDDFAANSKVLDEERAFLGKISGEVGNLLSALLQIDSLHIWYDTFQCVLRALEKASNLLQLVVDRCNCYWNMLLGGSLSFIAYSRSCLSNFRPHSYCFDYAHTAADLTGPFQFQICQSCSDNCACCPG